MLVSSVLLGTGAMREAQRLDEGRFRAFCKESDTGRPGEDAT
jgi:hypothetical protein